MNQGIVNVRPVEIAFQLRAIDCLRRVNLPEKRGMQGLRPQLTEQPFRLDIHWIIPDVGQQACSKIEEGSVIEVLTTPQNSNIVQMPVLIAKQHVRLKQHGQIRAKAAQTGQPFYIFYHPADFPL